MAAQDTQIVPTDASKETKSCSDTESAKTISQATEFIEAVRKKLNGNSVSQFDAKVLNPFRLPTKWEEDLKQQKLEDKSPCNKLSLALSVPDVKKFIELAQEAFQEGKLDKKKVESAAKDFKK